MKEVFNALGNMNFFAGLSVVASTIIAIFLFQTYAKKKLPEGTVINEKDKLNEYWYVIFFCFGVIGQAMAENYLDFVDAIFTVISDTIFNVIIFFICYGVLTLAKVDQENEFERCQKAFIGVILLTFGLLYLADYAIKNGLG